MYLVDSAPAWPFHTCSRTIAICPSATITMAAVVPNHSLDGESKSELLVGLSAAFLLFNTTVVAARIYTRAVMLRNFGIDDVFIAITQVCPITKL